MTSREWIDFLAKEWNVSNQTAKKMAHAMHEIKKDDNIQKSLNKPKNKGGGF